MMIKLTQPIIDKLIKWEEAGNRLHIYSWPDKEFVWEVFSAKNLDAGKDVDTVTLTLRRDYSNWSVTVERQEQLERDFVWMFVADVGQCITEIGVA